MLKSITELVKSSKDLNKSIVDTREIKNCAGLSFSLLGTQTKSTVKTTNNAR